MIYNTVTHQILSSFTTRKHTKNEGGLRKLQYTTFDNQVIMQARLPLQF